jgi:hypothetical protein
MAKSHEQAGKGELAWGTLIAFIGFLMVGDFFNRD